MDLHVQRGAAPGRAGVLGGRRLGALRLPGFPGSRPAAGRPHLRVRRAGLASARGPAAGTGLPGRLAHEPAAAARVLGSAARSPSGRRLGGARLALPLPHARRGTKGWPHGRIPGRVRPPAGLPTALGPAAGRAALLRSGRARGLQRHRLAARAAHGPPVGAAPGSGLVLPGRGRLPGPLDGGLPGALPRGAAQVAAAERRPALRAGLLRDGLPEALLRGHPALRDTRDGPQDPHPEHRRRVPCGGAPQGRRRGAAAREARQAVQRQQQRCVLRRMPPQVQSRLTGQRGGPGVGERTASTQADSEPAFPSYGPLIALLAHPRVLTY